MKEIKAGKKMNIVAQVSDQWGNSPASLDGPLSWSMEPVGGSLEVAPDSLSAIFTAGEGVGIMAVVVQGAGGGVAVGQQIGIEIKPGDVAAITLFPGNPY